MLQVDSILGSSGFIVNGIVCTIIKDHAVLQNLAYASTFVLVSGLQDLNCARSICSYGTGKEMASGAETELCRAEGVFYCSVGR